MYLQLCTNRADSLHSLYRDVNTLNHETPDDERNGRSKHVDLDNKLYNKYIRKVNLVDLFI